MQLSKFVTYLMFGRQGISRIILQKLHETKISLILGLVAISVFLKSKTEFFSCWIKDTLKIFNSATEESLNWNKQTSIHGMFMQKLLVIISSKDYVKSWDVVIIVWWLWCIWHCDSGDDSLLSGSVALWLGNISWPSSIVSSSSNTWWTDIAILWLICLGSISSSSTMLHYLIALSLNDVSYSV